MSSPPINVTNSYEEQTSESYLVLVTVVYTPSETVYNPAPLPPNAQRNFLAGAGEGSPFHALHLQLEGVISVEGTLVRSATAEISNADFEVSLFALCSVSPRRDHVIFSTKDPPTVQKMPWPAQEDDVIEPLDGDYETWLLDDLDLSWLVESNGITV
jgi:hypothetical protein